MISFDTVRCLQPLQRNGDRHENLHEAPDNPRRISPEERRPLCFRPGPHARHSTRKQFATLPEAQAFGAAIGDGRTMIYAVTTLGHSAHITNARKNPTMKTKAVTAAQIDTLAQRLAETPIEPAASAKKAGDNFARLLAARISAERAVLAFTSIMTAETFDQAEVRLTLVLDYGNPDPAGEPIPAAEEAPKAAINVVVGKRQAILDQAGSGAQPQPPDFSKATHAQFRAKLAQIVALAKAGDIAGLQAFEINPVSSSPKATARYRDLCVIAITARAQVTS
ncbi:hypothetical protein EEB11_17460 [Pseudotabrizicola sediminis]|uniref:Uncharacterized protein n=1 Tax=Pseudotabrizicola sediminis TaxID=2486418 RepID=A0ABY2KHG2_9RHOB|nr:hypothetical protein [Pseudotabrizicola sediminis]TGD41692.1 hypothetical protein EEB11_17460 [Pseudotabrizicola sediminis]